MNTKRFLLACIATLITFAGFAQTGFAQTDFAQTDHYIFSAVSPSGHTLYYLYRLDYMHSDSAQGMYVYNTVLTVTYPKYGQSSGNYYSGYTKPTGDVVIPDSVNGYPVRYIDGCCFYNCSQITSISIPDGVTEIHGNAFQGCSSLTSINIPDGVTYIGPQAFWGCSSLTSISLPDGVTVIGNSVFYGCSSLTSISLPDGVTEIGHDAFRDCSSLTSISLPDGVTEIGTLAFLSCSSLTSINIPDGVTYIGSSTFESCSSLSSITIPDGVTEIGNYAFESCSNLTSITLPDGLTEIGHDAFRGCSSLTSITLPDGVTEIGDYTFDGCNNLTSINIPDGVTEIGARAFNCCFSLTSITLPDGLTEIGECAFSYCISLTSINIPDSVTKISIGTFYDCRNLASINIPDGLTSIGSQAFRSCFSLTSITIPAGVTSIGDQAFYDCNSLDTIFVLSDTPPTLYLNLLYPSVFTHSATVIVPCNSRSVYQSAWDGYGHTFLEPDADVAMSLVSSNPEWGDAIILPQDGHLVLCSDSSTIISATGKYGYHFTQWSNGSVMNPDTLYLMGDSTVTAYFDKNIYYVSVAPNYAERGIVNGSDSAAYLDSITISATANYGYHFTKWSDNKTYNPRTVLVTGNKTYTAQFNYNQYCIALAVDTNIHGTVSGAGSYNYLSERTITALPAYGHHFTHWSDGSTENPRILTLTQDTAFTAFFAKNSYAILTASNNDTLGYAMGGGMFDYLDSLQIEAVCTAEHHHFVRWSDSNGDNPRTLLVERDSLLTAIFAIDTHAVLLAVNDAQIGSVEGPAETPYGGMVTLTAVAEEGYHFGAWSNGAMDNPYTLTVVSDTAVTAFFTADLTPKLCMVGVSDWKNQLIWEPLEEPCAAYRLYREGDVAGVYELMAEVPYDSSTTFIDSTSRPMTRSYRYRISGVDPYGREGEQSPEHKTMHLTISQGVGNRWNLVWTEYEGADYSTYIIYRGTNQDDLQQIDIMSSGGNTTYTDEEAPVGDVYYQVGVVMTTPCNPTKSSSISLSNIATNGEVGIRTLTDDGIHVSVVRGHINVTGGADVPSWAVYDAMGRMVASHPCAGETEELPAGVYMVKVGHLPAHKVVVIR